MEQIKLYDRQPIAEMLSEFGFAVELFNGWQNSVSSSHGHDVLEMNYIIRGEAIQRTGEVSGRLKRGSLSVINYGLEHQIITEFGDIDIINIYIDIERLRLPQLDGRLRSLLRGIIPLHKTSINNLNKVVVVQISEQEKFEKLLCEMINEHLSKKTGYQAALRQYFTLFLVMLCRFADENEPGRSCPANQRDAEQIDRLVGYIESNCHKYLSLERLANLAGLDRHSLCRKFKSVTGKTVFGYIKSRRLEAAMYELRSTDKKILDIALDCGFANISNFNRTFKEEIKTTPTQYRASLSIS